MTALGINITTNDNTHDHTGLISGHQVSSEIWEADHEEAELWDFYTNKVDFWIQEKYRALEKGDSYRYQCLVNEMEFAAARAEAATAHALKLRKQRHCPHNHIEAGGSGMRFSDDGPYDGEYDYCLDCEMINPPSKPSVPVSLEEIPV